MPLRQPQVATNPPARRVVVLVLDGLRADLIGDPRFPNLIALRNASAHTVSATTVQPSVTAVAMTSHASRNEAGCVASSTAANGGDASHAEIKQWKTRKSPGGCVPV